MKRIIFVLAVVMLLTVTALPAMAANNDGQNNDWNNNSGGNGVTVVDISGQNSFGQQYPFYNYNTFCGWYPSFWGWSYWCYSPWWGWWEIW